MENNNEKTSVDTPEKKKKRRKVSDTIIGIFMIAIIIFLVAQIPLGILLENLINNQHGLDIYTVFIGPFIAILLVIYLIKRNNYMKEKLPVKFDHILIGLAIGLALNLICAFAAMLHGDLVFKPGTYNILVIILGFIFCFIQSSTEELYFRLFMYQRIKETHKSPLVPIMATGILFGVFHLGNPGMTILSISEIILIGIFFAMLIYYFDSIWLVCAIHAAWNFTQNLILGLPNSGLPAVESIFAVASSNNSFFYDTGFGIEGSGFSVIIIVIACIITYLLCRNKKVNFDEKELSEN